MPNSPDGTSHSGSTGVASGQAIASTTATSISARTGRLGLTVRNLDVAITIYIGGVGVTAANGFPLLAGESIPVDTAAALYYVAASGGPSIAWIETYV